MFMKTQKLPTDAVSNNSGGVDRSINFNKDLEVFNELLFASSRSAGNSREYSPQRLV